MLSAWTEQQKFENKLSICTYTHNIDVKSTSINEAKMDCSHFDQSPSIQPDPCSFTNNLCWVDKVIQNSTVHSSQSATTGKDDQATTMLFTNIATTLAQMTTFIQ